MSSGSYCNLHILFNVQMLNQTPINKFFFFLRNQNGYIITKRLSLQHKVCQRDRQ